MQAIVRVGMQDLIVIRADERHSPHSMRFEPNATREHQINHDAVSARTNQLLAQSSRGVDMAGWLG
eukprot:564727-Karenia_brevis.AAC.1